MAKFVGAAICTLSLIVCCSAVSIVPIRNKIIEKNELHLIKSSNNLRLRGGGLLNWLDPRTPVSWPTYPKDAIPADGSVGGHYTLEEICGSGRFIGEFVLAFEVDYTFMTDVHLS
jgi:hypothetical protein